MITYVKRNWIQIREGGLISVSDKIQRRLPLLWNSIAAIMLFPAVMVLRLLKPVVWIRLGQLRSHRLGHFAPEPEFYCCERDLGLHEKKAIDIFYLTYPLCNTQLTAMWKRVLRVYPRIIKWLDNANQFIPGGADHVVPRVSNAISPERDFGDVLRQCKPHLSFTDGEERKGKSEIERLGISPTKPFIVFYSRDRAYLDKVLPRKWMLSWTYHDYRNGNIMNYIPAVKGMVERGFSAVRMGYVVESALPKLGPHIIDYSTNGFRSDFLDLYLVSKCKFMISGAGGLCGLAVPFRKPVVYVNFIPIEGIWDWDENHLTIFKKLWLVSEKRFLSIREMFETGAAAYYRGGFYEKQGIECIENTPEEINDVVLEMDQRLSGTWKENEEDVELQRRFWKLLETYSWHRIQRSRIGAIFLRNNRTLLD